MRHPLILEEAERLTLLQLSLNHRHRDIRYRAAGLLRLSQGLKPQQVCEELGVSHQTPYSWLKAWRTLGIVGLLSGHIGGRPPSLSPEWIASAVKIATEQPLSLAEIAKQVERVHNIELPCNLDTLSRALKRHGITYKRARFSLKKTQ
jgi:transposase